MTCWVEYDLRCYEAQQERLEKEAAYQERQEAEEAEAEAAANNKLVTGALASCDPLKSIPFFGDIAYLLNEVASQEDNVNMAMCRALMEAARRGERYAQDALNLVSSHFVEVV